MDTSIASAVREVIGESGYGGLTVDAVAARAGVSKAAIYRRFSSKQEMTFAVLLHDVDQQSPADTGSLRGDLVALIEQITAHLVSPGAGTLSGLLADVRADPNLHARFDSTFLAVERAIITEVVDRAIERGEVANRPDPTVVHALILGPLFAWLIVLDEGTAGVPALIELVATTAADALTRDLLPAATP
ncbi:TetR family transcriptional regulator [Nocardia caishijiensis]|uniref:TetR family transcriptional regulator n=1 Tax=Nocardia caishijiensis TaxID=184756 RepID=A0ABQ6YQP8_9NOCA|nr:TetR family transcriptional regulator [Nocardia caishijiensis]